MTIDKITDNYNPQGTGTACNYANACAYKLPCGLCRLTMTQCPKEFSYPNITWTNAEGKL